MTRLSVTCFGAAALCVALSISLARALDETTASSSPKEKEILRIAEEVRKQIVTLPNYGVFDHIHFAIKGSDTVVLQGRVSRPTLKSSAENVVRRIEGVTTVDNQIQVLPASPNDDRIRAAVYNSIYGFPALQRYTSNRGGGPRTTIARQAGGITADPPLGFHAIRIIVENGNVTLVGVVDNEADLAIAGMRANIVPGVFSVDNDLQVANNQAK